MDIRENIKGTQFTWAQALYQKDWGVHIFPTAIQKENIEKIAQKLQLVADYYKKAVYVKSWLRCPAYNEKIGGKPHSAHIEGKAVDFFVDGVSCDEIRAYLEPKLEEWNCRVEDKPGSSWVHLDNAPVLYTRFFKP